MHWDHRSSTFSQHSHDPQQPAHPSHCQGQPAAPQPCPVPFKHLNPSSFNQLSCKRRCVLPCQPKEGPLTSPILCIFVFRFLSSKYQKQGRTGYTFTTTRLYKQVPISYWLPLSLFLCSIPRRAPATVTDKGLAKCSRSDSTPAFTAIYIAWMGRSVRTKCMWAVFARPDTLQANWSGSTSGPPNTSLHHVQLYEAWRNQQEKNSQTHREKQSTRVWHGRGEGNNAASRTWDRGTTGPVANAKGLHGSIKPR